jgi:hypothetical protein
MSGVGPRLPGLARVSALVRQRTFRNRRGEARGITPAATGLMVWDGAEHARRRTRLFHGLGGEDGHHGRGPEALAGGGTLRGLS